MEHIPFEIICRIADGMTNEKNLSDYLSHLESCRICQNEVQFQRSIIIVSKQSELINPTKNFTKGVLESISPSKQKAWYNTLLHNMGNIIAMMAVLAFLAYIFSIAGSIGLQIDKPTDSKAVSEFVKITQEASQKFTELLILKLPKTTTSHSQTSTVFVAIIAITLLLIIDRVAQLILRRSN